MDFKVSWRMLPDNGKRAWRRVRLKASVKAGKRARKSDYHGGEVLFFLPLA